MRTQLPPMSEAQFEAQFVEFVGMHGWQGNHHRKGVVGQSAANKGRWVTGTTVKGWPDWTLWHETRVKHVYVELKSEKGRLSAHQKSVIESLRKAGQVVYVFRPSDWDEVEAVFGKAAA